MAYSKKDSNLLASLYLAIEERKKHAFAAPTYKDSADLKTILSIINEHLQQEQQPDANTLEDTTAILRYVAGCYDSMCRWGASAPVYEQLFKLDALLAKYQSDNPFSSDFYYAVVARNRYVHDECTDLIEIARTMLSSEVIQEFLDDAMADVLGMLKADPVEASAEYLAVIDEVEEEIEKNMTVDLCFEAWNLKKEYLASHGIDWNSPQIMNPHVMFD